MKYPENIEELSLLPIDYMGLIFYDKSPRCFMCEDKDISPDARREALLSIPLHIKKTGVFVNEEPMHIFFYVKHLKLDAIQLHGNESIEDCAIIKRSCPNAEIIKAVNISAADDFKSTEKYEGIVDYLLFDTKTSQHGGSGQKFDWNILNEYKGETPFFLSGGISIDDAVNIKGIKHTMLNGIDLNSKFETKPGLKDIELLNLFIKQLKDEQD